LNPVAKRKIPNPLAANYEPKPADADAGLTWVGLKEESASVMLF
jgi:hypothetical protein